MIKLKYVTKDNASPNGKSKVYFSCHKNDFKYFKEICDDIFERQDCAIYYLDNFEQLSGEELEDYKFQISQMQLFVFPISLNLLTYDCRSLEIDFKVAEENNIPILPLMYGENLAELFKEKCGRLQYLNKYKIDETAISYDKKLTDFLSNTLISDELAQKVRDAFDAYIFLSYRKKDRLHANEVMKEIHKNEFTRDIAIWFDEFLVPGEDFGEAIQKALNKSDLFAMVVTPNLVNERNYVMNVEYPNAVELNKKILPIEAVKTDKELLKNYYKDIPESVNLKENQKLTETLLNNIKNLALRQDDDPKHNFYIGLAYINGIDVEVDREKGFELIKNSAEKDCVEAMYFLSEAYTFGKGAKVDTEKAIYWNKKLCELDEEFADEIPECKVTLAINLFKLMTAYSNQSKFEEVKECFEKIKNITNYENLSLQMYKDLLYTKINAGGLIYQVSKLLKREGEEFEYLNYQEKMLDFYKSEFEFEPRDYLSELLLTTNIWTYYIYKPDLQKAEIYYQKAKSILEEMKNLNVDQFYQSAKLQVNFTFVQQLQIQNQFEKSIELLEDLVSDYNKNKSKDSILYSDHLGLQAINYLATSYYHIGRYDEAIDNLQYIIDNLSPNNEPLEEQTFNNILLNVYHCMAGCYTMLGNDEKKDFYNSLALKFAEITKSKAKELFYTGEIDFVYPTGVRFVGKLENGFRQGYGEVYLPNGDKYEGEFVYDNMQGKGKYTNVDGSYYTGEWKNNKPDGYGQFIEINKNNYEGNFKEGKREGFGKLCNALGFVYQGQWKDDKMNGHGKYIAPNGDVFEGEWKDNLINGYGKFLWSDGDMYEGEWKDNVKEGKGRFAWSDGDCYEGEFKDDEMSGYGVFLYNNGARYEGQFLNDARNGKGTFAFEDYVYEGDFVEGQWTGYGVLTFEDGTKYEGDFVEGRFEGKGTFYESGVLSYIGEFKDDMRHGYGKELDKDGNVIYEGNWENDEKIDKK